MAKKRTFKLLSKTTLIYLIFTFIAFYISAVILTNEADEYIDNTVEHQFSRVQHYTEHLLGVADHEHDDKITEREELPTERVEKRGLTIIPLYSDVDTSRYPVYSDTLIEFQDLDEVHRARKKTIIIPTDARMYRVEIFRPIEDMLKLRDDIFGALIPAFIALALGVVGFNYLMSGYFFRAYNKILDAMRTYKIGEKKELPTVKTNTTEFVRMQDLFRRMIHRIEDDYQHLKEYTENMAHEIQTPLAVIRNKIEHLIGDEHVMESHAVSIKTIYSETNHLSKLGNTLNLLTKIENNEFRDVQKIKTEHLLEKHISAISELARLKGLEIRKELNPDHTVHLDPFLMDIVIKNLLRNAVSYGSDAGPIQVSTTEKSLEVSNAGEPLDIQQDKLFERFVSNGKSNDSLGLGLALVKKICDSNNLDVKYRYDYGRHIFIVESTNGRML